VGLAKIPSEWKKISAKYTATSLSDKTISDFKKVYLHCLQETFGDEKYWEQIAKERPEEFAREWIDEPKNLFRNECSLIYLNKEVIGLYLVAYDEDDPKVGTIEFIGTIPKLRGRGIGLDLYRMTIMSLSRCGFKQYLGGTAQNNTPMIKLFEKMSQEIKLIIREDFE